MGRPKLDLDPDSFQQHIVDTFDFHHVESGLSYAEAICSLAIVAYRLLIEQSEKEDNHGPSEETA